MTKGQEAFCEWCHSTGDEWGAAFTFVGNKSEWTHMEVGNADNCLEQLQEKPKNIPSCQWLISSNALYTNQLMTWLNNS